MTIIVYGIKNCDTVKKALNWLSAHHVEHRLHDYRVDGLDVNWLNQAEKAFGWEALVNKRSTTWRNLDQAPHAYRDIACIIHQMTCISLEGDTGTGSQLPAFSLRYKHAIPYLIAYPWSHLEGDPAFQRIVLHHFYL